jgi:hypothetical protein
LDNELTLSIAPNLVLRPGDDPKVLKDSRDTGCPVAFGAPTIDSEMIVGVGKIPRALPTFLRVRPVEYIRPDGKHLTWGQLDEHDVSAFEIAPPSASSCPGWLKRPPLAGWVKSPKAAVPTLDDTDWRAFEGVYGSNYANAATRATARTFLSQAQAGDCPAQYLMIYQAVSCEQSTRTQLRGHRRARLFRSRPSLSKKAQCGEAVSLAA